jgi:hypothetical protein
MIVDENLKLIAAVVVDKNNSFSSDRSFEKK